MMANVSGTASAVATSTAEPMEDGQNKAPEVVSTIVDKKMEEPAPVADGQPTEMTR